MPFVTFYTEKPALRYQHHIVISVAIPSPFKYHGYCSEIGPCFHEIRYGSILEQINSIIKEFGAKYPHVTYLDISNPFVRNIVSMIEKRKFYVSGDVHLTDASAKQLAEKYSSFFAKNHATFFGQ